MFKVWKGRAREGERRRSGSLSGAIVLMNLPFLKGVAHELCSIAFTLVCSHVFFFSFPIKHFHSASPASFPKVQVKC